MNCPQNTSQPETTRSASSLAFPAQMTSDWIAHDFRFHTGELMQDLRLHYTTIGEPSSEAVLVLHGTTGSGTKLLSPEFAGELFGPGQPLDARTHYIVLPDSIGAGGSSKPSDGLRTKFPRYNYDDMVLAQYRLIKEGLGIDHLRLVLGNSMGGAHTWLWGVRYPDFMDALVPTASQPTPMTGRNWMMRRMIIDSIRRDPAWMDGDYSEQPPAAGFASVFFGIATDGGSLAYELAAPTREAADRLLDERLKAPFQGDANDILYQWEASRDYDASKEIQRIKASLLAINSADDERNPPETGIMARELARLPNARYYLIPASSKTHGHGTTGYAAFWKAQLRDWLPAVARRNVGSTNSGTP